MVDPKMDQLGESSRLPEQTRSEVFAARAPGAHWDARFWSAPTVHEVSDWVASKNMPRRVVARFEASGGVSYCRISGWQDQATRARITKEQAAARLGVTPAFLVMWTQLHAQTQRRPRVAVSPPPTRMAMPKTVEPARPGQTASFEPPPDNDTKEEPGWWHSDS